MERWWKSRMRTTLALLQLRSNRVGSSSRPCWIVATLFLLVASVLAEEPGSVLYQADFDDGKIPKPLFERFPSMEIIEGALVVTQGAKHAASPTLPIPFRDGELRFRFRMNAEVDFFSCRFEDASRVENASAHLGRLEIRPKVASLKLDQPPKDREYRESAVLATHDADFADGAWHQVVIRFEGSTVTVVVDETETLQGTHPHFGNEKIGTFFVLRSGKVELDDLRLIEFETKTSGKPADLERSLTIFHDYVDPLFSRHCYECHSHEAKNAKGGLVVDSLNPMLKGGDLGPALVPGNPEESLIFEALSYHDDDLQMPPDGKLGELEIGKVREWIALGAAHPRTGPAIEEEEYGGPRAEDLWSLKPLGEFVPTHSTENVVDAFLLESLEEAGLNFSPDAKPSEILRRLHYVLTGLPPTPEQTERFRSLAIQDLDEAIASTTDRLLASRHFGERWGRHWLDVARYADVSGATNPKPFPEAWRFREWAVHSFNSDKPWDQFVREQLAGDLLPAENPAAKTEQLIATGYLALPHVLAVDRDKERLKLDTIDEQLDVIGKTFLGIQIGCARCHDHKIDPFPTADYYAMAGIFRSTNTLKESASQETLETAGAELKDSAESLPIWMRGGKGVTIHSTSDADEARDEPIHLRGEQDMLGEIIPRGFPTMLTATAHPEIPGGESGRIQLADWILAEDNSLAARVFVNRVWHHVFGQGIVRSTDNFGLTGDTPSHPELLDFLAVRFRDHHGHSFKSLIRELVTSRAFRQSSRALSAGLEIDPENRLLWRSNLRRSDAESLIDAIQWVSGTLDLKPATGTVPEFKRGNQASTSQLEIPTATLRKRALYWPVFRKDIPIMMDVLSIFDFPPATAPRGRRGATRVPSQSLALLNSPIVLDAARALQRSLPQADDEARLEDLYRRTLARKPSEFERNGALTFLRTFEKGLTKEEAAKPANVANVAWNRLCHTLLVSNEFITIP